MALTVLRLSSCGVDNLAAELMLGGVDDFAAELVLGGVDGVDLPELYVVETMLLQKGLVL